MTYYAFGDTGTNQVHLLCTREDTPNTYYVINGAWVFELDNDNTIVSPKSLVGQKLNLLWSGQILNCHGYNEGIEYVNTILSGQRQQSATQLVDVPDQPMKDISVPGDKLRKICECVVENYLAVEYDYERECLYCGALISFRKDINSMEHKEDCPYLIAADILSNLNAK